MIRERNTMDTAQFLAAGVFIDSDSPQVVAFAKQATEGAPDPRPPCCGFTPPSATASSTTLMSISPIRRTIGRAACSPPGARFCIGKVGAAGGERARDRRSGPRRLCRRAKSSHLAAASMKKSKRTVFCWHSYTELYLSGRWVKATPAFDRALCDRARASNRSNSTARPIRCSSRSIGPAGGTWNI